MTGLDRRIQKADKLTQQGDSTCQRCGGPPVPGEPIEYDVSWDHREIWEEDDPAEEEETHCPDCGRQLVYEISWGDPEPPPHVQAWIQEQREQARAKELLDGLGFGADGEER